jgi:predicted transcriptional regulator of viral defense system
MPYMREESARPDSLVARLAARQHGVVTFEQLLACGVSRSGITRQVKSGRLHRIHRGVYALGHKRLTFEGRCMAAVLACGEGAVASHRAAGTLWGMLPPSPGPVEVTVHGYGGRRKRRGIIVHRSITLRPELVIRRHNIPVTQPARTLQDLRQSSSRRRPGAHSTCDSTSRPLSTRNPTSHAAAWSADSSGFADPVPYPARK